MEITERIQSRKDVKAISVRLLGDYKSVNIAAGIRATVAFLAPETLILPVSL